MPQNVLITGGAGYVGSTLTHLMLDRGYRVTAIDNLSFGGEALLGAYHHPSFSFRHGDITEDGVLQSAFADDRFDAIVHLAAIVGDPDQVVAKLRAYRDVGVEAFILSGYTHIAECDLVARYVLPEIEHSPIRPRWN